MARIGGRLGTLIGLGRTTAERDLARLRLRRADAALPAVPGGGPIAFDAAPPSRLRTLPARPVPLRSVHEHRAELLARVRAVLADLRIPVVAIPSDRGTGPTLGVRDIDWSHVLDVLEHGGLGLLLGGGERHRDASLRVHAPCLPEGAAADWTSLSVLDPAATWEGGRAIARYGFEAAVELDRWDRTDEGLWAARRWNPCTALLESGAFRVEGASEEHLDPVALEPLSAPHLFATTFPIDVVYTWVDGTDPAWIERKRAAVESFTGEPMTEDAASDLRFVDHDELRHSLRSIERYAPWVRHIHLVTDRQRPTWLAEDHPRITVVDHTEIADPATALPTFNSHAIEANLHRIEGLAEHFVYFNDDVFLSSPVSPDLFFSANGIAHMYLSRAQVGPGAPREGEAASDTAGKNARAMVMEAAGRRVSRKLFHAPFALRRSVSWEIEERWPDSVAATRASRFRRTADITLAGALHMAHAYATGRAVTRGLRYRYVNVGAADAAERLEGLLRDRHALQTFCLNEADPELDPATLDVQVRAFLARRFPDRSTFEKPTRR